MAALGMSLGELSKKANGNAALAKSVNSAER